MKVLWLAAYPYEFVVEKTKSRPHPVPWVTELAAELAKDCELTILGFSWRAPENVTVRKDGINFVFIRIPNPIIDVCTFGAFRIMRIRKWLKSNVHAFDIMHINGVEYQFGKAAANLPVPTVVSIQGFIHKYLPYKKKVDFGYLVWLSGLQHEKSEIRHFHNFICRTHWDTSTVLALNPTARIFTNWELIRAIFLQEGHGSFESNQIAFLGGLNPIKGITDALRVIEALHRTGHYFTLTVIGYGSKEAIEKIIAAEKLAVSSEQVQFLGFRSAEEIIEVYKKSFCLLHPTLIDNSPNTVCEAQLFGLPVLAHDTGGVSSLIEQKRTGYLVQMHDIEGFVSAILELKTDRSLYENMILSSRDLAKDRHDKDTIVNKLFAIYREVVKNEGGNEKY